MPNRKTRAETAAENRAAVLDAARRHFERHGYHGASLDAIAEDAGFSKGAVYSRFDSKDDLFLAVLADHIERRHQASAAQLRSATGPVDFGELRRSSLAASVESVAWQAALLEFRAHAWRNPEINARYARLHARTVESIAGFIEGIFALDERTPPLPAEDLARAALASATGVVAEYMADPDLDPIGLAELTSPPLDQPFEERMTTT